MMGIGVLCAAGAVVAPGLQAQTRAERNAILSVNNASSIGTFTPASGDPRLAAMLSRSGLPESGFRFTPSEAGAGANRAVTVAVRSRTLRNQQGGQLAAVMPSVKVAPIAYNLGVSVGWKKFAVTADLAKVDAIPQSVGRQRIDLGTAFAESTKRSAPRITANTSRNAIETPLLTDDDQNGAIDVGGSYSVTRNLAVTAGLRYKNEDQRLPRLTNTDNRRDSQAVYVGTAFRF